MIISRPKNENGPATVAAVPSLGSTNPGKEKEMNEVTNTTAGQAKSKPTDAQIVAAMDDLMGDVHLLRKAAMVAEEFTLMEFKRSKTKQYGTVFEYGLTTEQVDGVAYMLMHVRNLAEQLEAAWDKAFGMEGAQ